MNCSTYQRILLQETKRRSKNNHRGKPIRCNFSSKATHQPPRTARCTTHARDQPIKQPPIFSSPFPSSTPAPLPSLSLSPHSPAAASPARRRAADLVGDALEMAMALRRLAGAPGSPSLASSAAAAALLLRHSALTRPISTGFREERDTFGPIQVPNDKYAVPSSAPNT